MFFFDFKFPWWLLKNKLGRINVIKKLGIHYYWEIKLSSFYKRWINFSNLIVLFMLIAFFLWVKLYFLCKYNFYEDTSTYIIKKDFFLQYISDYKIEMFDYRFLNESFAFDLDMNFTTDTEFLKKDLFKNWPNSFHSPATGCYYIFYFYYLNILLYLMFFYLFLHIFITSKIRKRFKSDFKKKETFFFLDYLFYFFYLLYNIFSLFLILGLIIFYIWLYYNLNLFFSNNFINNIHLFGEYYLFFVYNN